MSGYMFFRNFMPACFNLPPENTVEATKVEIAMMEVVFIVVKGMDLDVWLLK
jgi:hypothetical protein